MPPKKEKFQGEIPLSKGVICVDASLCGSCKVCMYACSLHNDGVAALDLARIQVNSNDIDSFDTHVEPCLQCVEPLCMRNCPMGAIYADESTGARVIDQEICIGCKKCIRSCPYEVPRIRFDAVRKKSTKCDLCNGDPQCVQLCPTGALTYRANQDGVQSGYGAKGERG